MIKRCRDGSYLKPENEENLCFFFSSTHRSTFAPLPKHTQILLQWSDILVCQIMNIFTELIKEKYVNTAGGSKIYTTPCRVCGSVRNHASLYECLFFSTVCIMYTAYSKFCECPADWNNHICLYLGFSMWENMQTLVCEGLCDTHSTGGLISSGLVSKKRRTSSLCEIWGGSRTRAWQTNRTWNWTIRIKTSRQPTKNTAD